jgi:hypothetical protein
MQPLMDIIGGVEVTAQYPLEVFAQECLDHLTATRVMRPYEPFHALSQSVAKLSVGNGQTLGNPLLLTRYFC